MDNKIVIGQKHFEPQKIYIKMPITAELLINLAKNFYKRPSARTTSRGGDLVPKIGDALFEIVRGWLKLTDKDKSTFNDFFAQAIISENCNIQKLYFEKVESKPAAPLVVNKQKRPIDIAPQYEKQSEPMTKKKRSFGGRKTRKHC
jgi:hypothetical protein